MSGAHTTHPCQECGGHCPSWGCCRTMTFADCRSVIADKNAEIERLREERTKLLDCLLSVLDRLEYLQGLWGKEGISERVVQMIDAALKSK